MEELFIEHRRYLNACKAWSLAKNPKFKAYWFGVMQKLWSNIQ